MKQTLLFLALIAVSFMSNAQTSAGNMMVGGELAFSSTSQQNSDTKSGSTSFRPTFGYFISDNLAVGASLSYTTSTTTSPLGKTSSSAFAIGPFARYYKFTSNDSFAFFGQAGLNFGFTNDSADNKGTSISLGVAPGFAYFFNEHWALEFMLPLLSISNSNPDTDVNNNSVTSVSFDLRSFSPSLGFRYHFGN